MNTAAREAGQLASDITKKQNISISDDEYEVCLVSGSVSANTVIIGLSQDNIGDDGGDIYSSYITSVKVI